MGVLSGEGHDARHSSACHFVQGRRSAACLRTDPRISERLRPRPRVYRVNCGVSENSSHGVYWYAESWRKQVACQLLQVKICAVSFDSFFVRMIEKRRWLVLSLFAPPWRSRLRDRKDLHQLLLRVQFPGCRCSSLDERRCKQEHFECRR